MEQNKNREVKNMKKYTQGQIVEEAMYIVQRRATYKECSEAFGVPHSTIGYHMLKMLNKIDNDLYNDVHKIAVKNSRGKNLCRN
jgi:hypothetical protein